MQVWKYAGMQVCKYASTPIWPYASMQVYKYASIQLFDYSSKYLRMWHEKLLNLVCNLKMQHKKWKLCRHFVTFQAMHQIEKNLLRKWHLIFSIWWLLFGTCYLWFVICDLQSVTLFLKLTFTCKKLFLLLVVVCLAIF